MIRPKKKKDEERIKLSKDAWKKATRIFQYLKPYRIKFGIGLIFLLLSSGASMVFPGLVGKLVDASSQSAEDPGFVNFENINTVAILLFGLFAANAIFSFLRIYLFSDVTERMLAALRRDTYGHIIKLPMNFFNAQRVGDLNSRISSDITLLQDAFTTVLAEFIRQILIITIGITLLVFYSWKLTLIMLASLPVVIVIAIFFGRFIKRLSKETQEAVSESNVIVEETFTGIVNVKSFANEFFEIFRYHKSTESIRKIAMKAAIWRGLFASFIIFALFGSIVLVIWQGVLLTESGELQMGELFSFILYSVFVGASFGGTADLFARIQKAVGATERLFELLDEAAEIPENAPDSKRIEGFKGEVSFDHVSFNYATREHTKVLDDISFTASSGETIALVGASGAGKSTTVNLVLGFYTQSKGSINVDGKPIQSYHLSALRNEMALVPQEVILFGGSIRENIAYGNTNATEEELIEAAKKANAWEFIERMEEGLDTLVGERGVQLSGGQKQRIAIARAILKDPKILILDEATSSLDSESEKLVQDALTKLMENRTSIVIAHRLSTIRKANRILVMENGRIAERGSHEELMKQDSGIYKNLTNLQTA